MPKVVHWRVGTVASSQALEFLRNNLVEPVKKIIRPLKTPILVEHGVPDWAQDFINAVPLSEVLDLVEAGTVLRIKM